METNKSISSLLNDINKIAKSTKKLTCLRYTHGSCLDFPGAMNHTYCPTCELRDRFAHLDNNFLPDMREKFKKYLKARRDVRRAKRAQEPYPGKKTP